MARLRRLDLEELAARPGTYFNPITEILIVRNPDKLTQWR